MRKLFLTMLLLILIAPFTLLSQNDTVREVIAKNNGNNVDLVWSHYDIVLDSLMVDFETGDFSQADFFNDPTAPWEITESAYEGKYAIKSTCEGQNKGISAVEVTVDVPYDAVMSFYHKVDCENFFDYAQFFIDGVERENVSGVMDWTYREFKVKKGVHTYRWTYRKDESDFEASKDVYFVDNIVLYKRVEPFTGGWIQYDDDHYVNALGSESGFIEWGVCFPNAEEYAGFNLTKVALYDANAATVKANIYFGGTYSPGAIVSSEEFKLTGAKKIKEFALNAPIPIAGNEPLWITFSSSDPTFVATYCYFTGDKNSDWVNFGDENGWQHLSNMDGGAYQFSWIVRGLLENSKGEKAVMTREKSAPSYNIYRTNEISGETVLLAENVTDTVYTDDEFATIGYGAYSWGIANAYDTVWSNEIAKDMYAKVNLKVSLDGNDSPAGVRVKLTNQIEKEYSYRLTLDESGTYTFDRFRKGKYELQAYTEGYETYKNEIEITGDYNVECVLNEIKAAVENLYVSPTGWASWENTDFDNGGDQFMFNFDDGSLDSWRTVDADGDGFNWCISDEVMSPWQGYNGSKLHIVSLSYHVEHGGLRPDNYLITKDKYLITETSQLSYYVAANSKESPAEHYAVLVSTVGDDNFENYEVVWEETMNRSAQATRKGYWYKRNIDLAKFAGQEIYIAFRHFDTYRQSCISIDDVALVNNAKSSRAVNGYTIKLNDKEVAKDVKTNYYQFEDLTVGETYKATVIVNYVSGTSEAAEYSWTYVSPKDYPGVKSLEGRSVAGKALLKWTFEGDEEGNVVEDSFFFNFNDSTLAGWRNVDADGDGNVWTNTAFDIGPGFGYKDSLFCAMSRSYYADGLDNYPLTPDNYMVTENRYAITEGSQLSFMVCATDPQYFAEHYGVAITMVENADAEEFVTIWEETIVSNDTDYETPQTPWVLRTIDLSQYAGEEIYIALRHFNCTDQFIINIDDVALTPGSKSTRNEKEVLGVMVFRDDVLLTETPITKRSFYTEFPGTDEYNFSVRVVYDDYGMSEPQYVLIDAPMECVAPRNLYGETTVNENGEYGVSLTWPFEISDWLSYDNNTPSSVFSNNGNNYYWGVLFPAEILEDYAGTSITKLKLYDYEAGSATVLVYHGNKSQPMIQKHIQNITYTGANQWVEIELDNAVPVTGKDHIWVLVYQKGNTVVCVDEGGNSNGRWFSANGSEWLDLKAINNSFNVVWALKAFVTSNTDNKRMAEDYQEIDLVVNNNDAKGEISLSHLDVTVSANETRESVLQNYNVYRGTDLNDITFLAETKEGKYFDAVSAGTYYYQVKAVYKEGDDECESGPANSFKNPDQNYVMIEVLGVDGNNVNGMMIYPNPTKNNLTVNAEAMTRITITNTLGQVVYDNNVNSDNEVVDMSQFDAGIYMVRITTENGSIVRKVSKI